MSSTRLAHTDLQIEHVVRGLVVVVDLQDAATQLCRLYGDERAEAALIMMGRRARAATRAKPEILVQPEPITIYLDDPDAERSPDEAITIDLDGPRARRSPAELHILRTSTAEPVPSRRGTRPNDWL